MRAGAWVRSPSRHAGSGGVFTNLIPPTPPFAFRGSGHTSHCAHRGSADTHHAAHRRKPHPHPHTTAIAEHARPTTPLLWSPAWVSNTYGGHHAHLHRPSPPPRDSISERTPDALTLGDHAHRTSGHESPGSHPGTFCPSLRADACIILYMMEVAVLGAVVSLEGGKGSFQRADQLGADQLKRGECRWYSWCRCGVRRSDESRQTTFVWSEVGWRGIIWLRRCTRMANNISSTQRSRGARSAHTALDAKRAHCP